MNALSNDARSAGLTALELLVALAVAGVVVGVGVPALQDAALNTRRLSAVNGLVGLIQFARSTAQTRSETVVMCKASPSLRCSDAGNGERWVVTLMPAAPVSETVANGAVLRVFEPGFSGPVVSNRSAFEFRPFPLRSTNGTVSFCDPRGGSHERAVVISPSGRPRTEQPSPGQELSACMAQ